LGAHFLYAILTCMCFVTVEHILFASNIKALEMISRGALKLRVVADKVLLIYSICIRCGERILHQRKYLPNIESVVFQNVV